MKLGKYFTLDEMIRSETAMAVGIDNRPSPSQIVALGNLVTKILDPLREAVNRPVRVTSGFRSHPLNKLVGGAQSSQHTMGEAADIKIPGYTIAQTVQIIRDLNLPFDQLIDEYSLWVHVSYRSVQRGQVLTARRNESGHTVYEAMA